MTLGERILKYRKKAGISQEELADRLNVTRQSISLWETDQTVPSLDSLITLAQIFGVSLDELCGLNGKDSQQLQETATDDKDTKENNEDTNVSDETNAEKPEPLACAKTTFTQSLFNDVRKLYFRKQLVTSIVALAASIMMLISFCLTNDGAHNDIVIIPIFFIIVSAALLIRTLVLIHAYKKRILDKFGFLVYKYLFYNDHLVVSTQSNTAESMLSIKYEEIKKTVKSGNYVFVYYGTSIMPVEIASISDKTDLVLTRLKLNVAALSNAKTDANNELSKTRSSVKTLLLVMFVLSIASIFMALFAVAIAMQLSPIPEYRYTMPEYMWLFLVFIPIPLTSTVLGIVYLAKKYKCLKNIIAGVIMCILLAIYGSFTFVFKDYNKHDNWLVEYVNIYAPIDLDEKAYVSYSEQKTYDEKTDEVRYYYQGIIKYDNKQLIASRVEASESFLPNNTIPADMLSSFEWSAMSDCDYYYLYNITFLAANDYYIYEQTCNYILLAYDVDKGLMYVHKFDYPKSFRYNYSFV